MLVWEVEKKKNRKKSGYMREAAGRKRGRGRTERERRNRARDREEREIERRDGDE